MPFELGIQVWKIMSFRWRPSSWMQFSILRLKSSIARANSCWSILSTSCRMASFNSPKLRGLWVYTRPFRYPQRKKSHDDMSGDLGGHGTSPKREMRRPGNMFRRTFIGACAVCAVFTLEYLTQMACLDLHFCTNKSISSWKSTEYFFFENRPTPVCHPVCTKYGDTTRLKSDYN